MLPVIKCETVLADAYYFNPKSSGTFHRSLMGSIAEMEDTAKNPLTQVLPCAIAVIAICKDLADLSH